MNDAGEGEQTGDMSSLTEGASLSSGEEWPAHLRVPNKFIAPNVFVKTVLLCKKQTNGSIVKGHLRPCLEQTYHTTDMFAHGVHDGMVKLATDALSNNLCRLVHRQPFCIK